MEAPRKQSEPIQAQLGLWDAVSIIIGIVIGAGIYETVPLILKNVSSPLQALGVWALGGFLSLVGALCYAELATTYPRSGGDYVYLTRAFGPWVGFLFGWAQLSVLMTGSIGMMAYIFADYAAAFWGHEENKFLYATLVVSGLSLLNILGVVLGKSAQNVLTAAKVIGLGGILVAGFSSGSPTAMVANTGSGGGTFGLAMIFVLYTYGGWNDAAFVAAEQRNRNRNIPLALILGTCAITIIYLLVNTAYLMALGFEDARESKAIAAEVLGKLLGSRGARAMSLLVMISALGAVNGLIFTGSRVYSTLGADHSILAWLGRWNGRLGSPVWSLLTQAVIAIILMAAVGTETGREAISSVLVSVGFGSLPWRGHGGFDTLLQSTAPVFWLFFLLTGLSLFVLREKDRGIERPFSVPLYPLLPVVFCDMCAYMLYSSVDYARKLVVIGFLPVLVGLPLYWISSMQRSDKHAIPKEA